METLLASSINKNLMFKEENTELKANVQSLEGMLEKTLDKCDNYKTRLSKYEPKSNDQNKKIINEFQKQKGTMMNI